MEKQQEIPLCRLIKQFKILGESMMGTGKRKALIGIWGGGALHLYRKGGREQINRGQEELLQIKAESKKKVLLYPRRKGHRTVNPNMQLEKPYSWLLKKSLPV